MKMIRKIMAGVGTALICAAMYYCFVCGAPQQGKGHLFYMAITGIFCVSVWAAVMGNIWYVKWLRRKNEELENMIDTLLKNTDELDK